MTHKEFLDLHSSCKQKQWNAGCPDEVITRDKMMTLSTMDTSITAHISHKLPPEIADNTHLFLNILTKELFGKK